MNSTQKSPAHTPGPWETVADPLDLDDTDAMEATSQMLNLLDDAEWTQARREACIDSARAAIAKAKGETI